MQATEFDFIDRRKINWETTVCWVVFHILAVTAFFFFDWKAVAVAAALYFVGICWGISLGYHRLLTHRSYRVPKLLEYFFAVCGTLSLEGGPLFWVAVHRIHHQKSDQSGDPHTPREGGWWAHILWTTTGDSMHNRPDLLAKYAPDLARDPFYRWLSTYHWVPLTVVGLCLLAFGGVSYLLWGVFFRTTVGLHATWLVNSATHIWGSQRFHTKDDSRNCWWVAMLVFGEGWHNNHHAHPASARHGLAWYELDLSWLQIRLMKALGIAQDVRVPKAEQLELKAIPVEERGARAA